MCFYFLYTVSTIIPSFRGDLLGDLLGDRFLLFYSVFWASLIFRFVLFWAFIHAAYLFVKMPVSSCTRADTHTHLYESVLDAMRCINANGLACQFQWEYASIRKCRGELHTEPKYFWAKMRQIFVAVHYQRIQTANLILCSYRKHQKQYHRIVVHSTSNVHEFNLYQANEKHKKKSDSNTILSLLVFYCVLGSSSLVVYLSLSLSLGRFGVLFYKDDFSFTRPLYQQKRRRRRTLDSY